MHDEKTRIELGDGADRWEWRCPQGHTQWEPTNYHWWCAQCASSWMDVDPCFDEIVSAKTGERLERDDVELVEADAETEPPRGREAGA